MLRPEQIALHAPAAEVNGCAVLGRILAALPVGPTATVMLHLPQAAGRGASTGETTLSFKTTRIDLPAAGSLVSVTIRGAAHVLEPSL